LLDQTKLIIKGGMVKINMADKIVFVRIDINLSYSMSDFNINDVAKVWNMKIKRVIEFKIGFD
jgi:hypothetical protein